MSEARAFLRKVQIDESISGCLHGKTLNNYRRRCGKRTSRIVTLNDTEENKWHVTTTAREWDFLLFRKQLEESN